MSFKQEIFMLLYLFIIGKDCPNEWFLQLKEDVLWLFKNSSFATFKLDLLSKAIYYSPKRLRFYHDFIKFIDKYLELN